MNESRLSYRRRRGLASFTLVEMLTVIAIIAILAALTLGAIVGAQNSALRGRARSEIQGFAALLENYKSDNGMYPLSDGSLKTNGYTVAPTTPAYIANSQILFQALTGKTNYTDTVTYGKSYTSLKSNQVGNANGPAAAYVMDPFGYPYGYSTGAYDSTHTQTDQPYNGAGSFDLWSTGGDITGKTNKYISNFQQ